MHLNTIFAKSINSDFTKVVLTVGGPEVDVKASTVYLIKKDNDEFDTYVSDSAGKVLKQNVGNSIKNVELITDDADKKRKLKFTFVEEISEGVDHVKIDLSEFGVDKYISIVELVDDAEHADKKVLKFTYADENTKPKIIEFAKIAATGSVSDLTGADDKLTIERLNDMAKAELVEADWTALKTFIADLKNTDNQTWV